MLQLMQQLTHARSTHNSQVSPSQPAAAGVGRGVLREACPLGVYSTRIRMSVQWSCVVCAEADHNAVKAEGSRKR